MTVLVVIPTLNEAPHIAGVIDAVSGFAGRGGALVVVADGGSRDRTCEIVQARMAQAPWLRLIDNPARLQSAAVNLAVETFGTGCDALIRLDAHSAYPADYCDILLAEAQATGAESVVVTMHAVGAAGLQAAIAAAQNSRFGNGAAAHRNATAGAWVEHGHHALIRLAAFREVGGYDPRFSHNEDAELDHRLRAKGARIWLTARTGLEYFPRATLGGLIRQYLNFGRGRARNLAKHRARPARRQLIVASLAPALLLTLLAPLSAVFAIPLGLWLLGCLAAGGLIWRETGRAGDVLAGPIAGLMQLAWSVGFWIETLSARRPAAPESLLESSR